MYRHVKAQQSLPSTAAFDLPLVGTPGSAPRLALCGLAPPSPQSPYMQPLGQSQMISDMKKRVTGRWGGQGLGGGGLPQRRRQGRLFGELTWDRRPVCTGKSQEGDQSRGSGGKGPEAD